METVKWLLQDADPALEYQVLRDLMHVDKKTLKGKQQMMLKGGCVNKLLGKRAPDGLWGGGFYTPKWLSTHYVLFELVHYEIPEDNASCKASAAMLFTNPYGCDGGINYARTIPYSDVCVNGMILTIASYFGVDSKLLNGITEYLLQMRMDDGGWNCAYYQGASKSSLHTTISVLEGLWMYLHKGGNYPKKDVEDAIKGGVDFILKHSLFKSVTTGEVIKDEFFRFCFPVRWKYDIMRCLDLFSRYRVPYDSRMDEALTYIVKAKNKNGVWKAYVQPGKTYFELEKQGTESRWNTLRALRILAFYNAFDEHKY